MTCYWFTGHVWGKWELVSYDMVDMIYDKEYMQTFQRRRCERCGKYQERPL